MNKKQKQLLLNEAKAFYEHLYKRIGSTREILLSSRGDLEDYAPLMDLLARSKLRVWYVSHAGEYLGGYSVIIAKDLRQARRILSKLLEEAKLKDYAPLAEPQFTELASHEPTGVMLFNGDY